jgi:hypothetical protein
MTEAQLLEGHAWVESATESEEAAALEASGAANTAANQAAFDQTQADAAAPPTNYNTGPSSYVSSAGAGVQHH